MSVEIRTYASDKAFQEDASRMAAAGWKVAAQSQVSKQTRAGEWVGAIGILIAVVGFFAIGIWAVIVGVALLVVGVMSRGPVYTVTYERGPDPG